MDTCTARDRTGTSPGSDLGARAVLTEARRKQRQLRRLQCDLLVSALAWADAHRVADPDLAATFGDTPVSLAGEGAPMIEQFCVLEFASALSMSSGAGQDLMADAIELGHRLPQVWARVLSGDLTAWKARLIASSTQGLSAEAAAFVDRQVAPFASRISQAELGRLVDTAIARFMPELAARRREDSADRRHVDIDHDQVSFDGTCRIDAEIDLADALDLDRRLSEDAAALKRLGSDAHLDARRAIALGHLARGERPLPLEHGEAVGPAADGPIPASVRGPALRRRVLVIHAHLRADALTSSHDVGAARHGGVALVEEGGRRLVTVEQIRAWAGDSNTQVIVRPVIDLNASYVSPGYAPSDRLRAQVELRDRTCVFPWCNRPARACDLDHIVPFGDGGNTRSDNLAALCRRHHRAKTHPGRHGIWSYQPIGPGTFEWTSPMGYRFLRDPAGTTSLTPDPVDPPDQRSGHPPDR